MKTLAEAAMDLPWLAPSVASLLTLARSQVPSTWTDPGMVLLSAQLSDSSAPSDVALLEAVLQHHEHYHLGFVDWSQPGPEAVLRVCHRQAILASRLAEKVGVDGRRAWIAGFLAPLGWLAVAAADAATIAASLKRLQENTDAASWQRQAWGHGHTALARRLGRCWRLPVWLASIIGHLGLHAGIAERLGAEAPLFRVVQLSVLLTQERGHGLGLTVGGDIASLLNEFHLNASDVDVIADATQMVPLPVQAWESPAKHVLLPDLLRLTLENRRRDDAVWIERLQQDLDHLQEVLVQQCVEEKNRLQTSKLSALAEFAAGAGHEINNPLAVISGQAQYVLKQMDWLDVPGEEIENVGEYLDGLREKITPSLHKIIGQTQRVHTILTDLMQFARPTASRLQTVSVHHLIDDVIGTLRTLAHERKIRLVAVPIEHDDYLNIDPNQARAALARLLRNAIEAAPTDGWAGIRIEKNASGMLDLIVEDNGGGPCPTIREHLFDPFFSGRSAGRGRGMGLPTAWRLARQQGGDVRFDGVIQGITRFVLTLPIAQAPIHSIGYHTEPTGRNGSHAAMVAKSG
jgi:two-component system, NtrC family, sensor kinase